MLCRGSVGNHKNLNAPVRQTARGKGDNQAQYKNAPATVSNGAEAEPFGVDIRASPSRQRCFFFPCRSGQQRDVIVGRTVAVIFEAA